MVLISLQQIQSGLCHVPSAGIAGCTVVAVVVVLVVVLVVVVVVVDTIVNED